MSSSGRSWHLADQMQRRNGFRRARSETLADLDGGWPISVQGRIQPRREPIFELTTPPPVGSSVRLLWRVPSPAIIRNALQIAISASTGSRRYNERPAHDGASGSN